ncbi:hypothetical protein L7F22_039709 [Adiantum nelumboides]|nr:hypothetical protein [Adiantum nelumboides]
MLLSMAEKEEGLEISKEEGILDQGLRSEGVRIEERGQGVAVEERIMVRNYGLYDSEEDIAKQVENARRRRQEILEKHNKRKQSEGVENAQLGSSNSVGDIEPFANERFSILSVHNLSQNDSLGRCSLIKATSKDKKDLIFGESPFGGQDLVNCGILASEMSGLSDEWDDAEGYYCHRVGEVLDGRLHGRGVFSSVVRARALSLKTSMNDSMEVAIKIIRNNSVMLKAGQQERNILERLNRADSNNNWYCKSGWKTGFCLGVTRVYAKQLFLALRHLSNRGILHSDIKPDNMLVNEAKNVLKLCDFGSAMFRGENESTPYLVSRFYRALEINNFGIAAV